MTNSKSDAEREEQIQSIGRTINEHGTKIDLSNFTQEELDRIEAEGEIQDSQSD